MASVLTQADVAKLLAEPSPLVRAELASKLAVEIDNPNLTRLDAGLPFTEVEVKRAAPGEVFGKIETREIDVDGTGYPKPTPPVDTNTSEHVAAELGVTEANRLRPKERKAKLK